MRAFQEIAENSKFVHDFERGGMNRVAAKIAQKVRVLFEHDNFDSGASQQKSQDHAGGPAANDAAAGCQLLGRWMVRGHGKCPGESWRVV
jgi:hypothetical protein